MTSPPSLQPKQWQAAAPGVTLKDGVFSSWNGHRPFSEPPPAFFERDVLRDDLVDARLLAHLGDVSSRIRPATSADPTPTRGQ